MRPIKDLLVEEFWSIAYRKADDNDYAFINKNKVFSAVKVNERYWYADPFLFEHKEKLYMFVEAFDNIDEKGKIACMVFNGKTFSEPEIVLEEAFHLSYPYVYEENGEIFMMPETSADGCIQIYKAVSFPYKWEKHKVLVRIENAVDTVKLENKLITSVVTDSNEKRVDVDVYDTDGNLLQKQLQKNSQQARGAGKIFSVGDDLIRPTQDSTGGIYGLGIRFFKLLNNYGKLEEKELYSLTTKEFSVAGYRSVFGVHTYARACGIEVLDFKSYRLNLKRNFWILKRKFFKE